MNERWSQIKEVVQKSANAFVASQGWRVVVVVAEGSGVDRFRLHNRFENECGSGPNL